MEFVNAESSIGRSISSGAFSNPPPHLRLHLALEDCGALGGLLPVRQRRATAPEAERSGGQRRMHGSGCVGGNPPASASRIRNEDRPKKQIGGR